MAKRLSVIVVFIIVVASLFATTNVYAFWSYTEPVGESSYLMGSVGMGEFIFTPEEVLPEDFLRSFILSLSASANAFTEDLGALSVI